MTDDSLEHRVYRFGGFELQPSERRLLIGCEPVPLTPKVFDALEVLVRRAGHIVSKEELLAQLWPGRFVLESNLTKHIWTLRKALGEGENGGRYIETVSKVGYRFVAPVTSGLLPEPATAPTAPQESGAVSEGPRKDRLRHMGTAALAAAVFALLALAAWWAWNGQRAVFPWSSEPPGTVVAILEFSNLSDDRKESWIGPAVQEVLTTELAFGGYLHPVPSDLVREAGADLPTSVAGGLSPGNLATLKRRLAADIIITGSYLARASGDASNVRVDFAVQDARSGATRAAFSRTGSIQDLPGLITAAGTEMRAALGAPLPGANSARLAANRAPPSVDVMRRIGYAIDALHHYDPNGAKEQLLQVIAEAPSYAPGYIYLSKAWTDLGYREKARAAAEQAAAHAANLPEFMRLEIAAQSAIAKYDWPSATKALRALSNVQHGDPEIALELIAVLLKSGDPHGAQQMLDELSARGTFAGDPRLELAAANIAGAQDDRLNSKAHAQRALQLADERGQTGLAAAAEQMLGNLETPGDSKAANAALQRALVDYRAVGNQRGEAGVLRDLGNLLSDTDPAGAREQYQRALTLFQSIGDLSGIASAQSDLGIVLWAAGDADGAGAAVRNVLDIARETEDPAREAWALAALAVEESDDRASDESVQNFREAAAIDARIGAHSHRGFSLFSLSDVLRLRGQLTEATIDCAAAQAEYARVNDPASRGYADFECALIALDRGAIDEVRHVLAGVRAAALLRKDTMMLGNADTTAAQILMGQEKWRDAIPLLMSAEGEFAQGDMTTGHAVAASLLAVCYLKSGNTNLGNAAAARALALRSRVTERQEVFQVDVALAVVGAAAGDRSKAVEELEALANDAGKRDWPGWALESQLAELEILRSDGKTARFRTLRASIESRAQQMGYTWVLKRLPRPI